MIFGVIRVAGHSLDPAYQDGDFVFVSKLPIYFGGIHPGDVIVFRHPSLGRLIKLVERLECKGTRVFVTGLNPYSRDSRTFGAIPREWVLGKVIGHIRKN